MRHAMMSFRYKVLIDYYCMVTNIIRLTIDVKDFEHHPLPSRGNYSFSLTEIPWFAKLYVFLRKGILSTFYNSLAPCELTSFAHIPRSFVKMKIFIIKPQS